MLIKAADTWGPHQVILQEKRVTSPYNHWRWYSGIEAFWPYHLPETAFEMERGLKITADIDGWKP